MTYKLLDKFQGLFDGQAYLHRISIHGDSVAVELYDDLRAIARSPKLVARVDSGRSVVNLKNTRVGIKRRRGDGAFGEIVPHVNAVDGPGYTVKRGPTATIEIGIEVKILSKAMMKQIDRVAGDLEKQVKQFKSRGGNAICVGIVGINRATHTIAYDGDRTTPTTGKGGFRHPIQEADEAERYLIANAASYFDEFLILKYKATNEPPTYPFAWADKKQTELLYGAALARISAEYERRV